MKLFLVAAALALAPAMSSASTGGAVPAAGAPAAEFPEKTQFLSEIQAWRDTQLRSAGPLAAQYGPLLDDLAARVTAAKTAKDLVKPRRDFTTWQESLSRAAFAAAQKNGAAPGTFPQFFSEQALQAEFSADLRQQISLGGAQQSLLRERRSFFLPAIANGANFFDLSTGRGGAVSGGPAVVTAPAPYAANDPARYAKVRAILISQGASAKIVDMAIKEALRQNADPLLVLSVINAESGFHTHATSSCGARGLMQIMPDTGRGLGVRNAGMLYDAQTNLQAGVKFLKSLWGEFVGGDMTTALASMNPFDSHGAKSAVAAYNAGAGAVHKYKGVPPYRETRGYVKTVLSYYNSLKAHLTWA